MNSFAGRSRTSWIIRSVDAMCRPSALTSPSPIAWMSWPAQPHSGCTSTSASGMRRAHLGQPVGPDAGMHVALAQPHLDVPVRTHASHVRAQEEVGQEEDALALRDRVDHVQHVAAGAAVVELRLHLGGGVHVPHRDVPGEARLPLPHVGRGDRVGQGAAGGEVGQQDPLLRRQDRRRLGHEVDAAEDDDRGVGLRRLARQPERVTHEVGDVLDLGTLVVVRDHDGIALPREPADLVLQLGDPFRREAVGFDDREGQGHSGCRAGRGGKSARRWLPWLSRRPRADRVMSWATLQLAVRAPRGRPASPARAVRVPPARRPGSPPCAPRPRPAS